MPPRLGAGRGSHAGRRWPDPAPPRAGHSGNGTRPDQHRCYLGPSLTHLVRGPERGPEWYRRSHLIQSGMALITWSLATPIRRKALTIPAPIAASRAPGFALGYETARAGFNRAQPRERRGLVEPIAEEICEA